MARAIGSSKPSSVSMPRPPRRRITKPKHDLWQIHFDRPNQAGLRDVTRVTGFLWDRGGDRLWRQGIDLIGDDRGGQVGQGIEDGAMLGQSEGGEFLDMPDDGFDDVAPVEQCLVEERRKRGKSPGIFGVRSY